MPLSARSVLVVGANRGLGLGFIKELLQLPTSPEIIIATCRNVESATELRVIADKNPSVKILQLDLEDDDSMSGAAEETKLIVGEKGLNLLLVNSGILEKLGPEPDIEIPERGSVPDSEWMTISTTKYLRSSYEHQTRESMQKHFNVNTTGPLILVQMFLPLLKSSASFDTTAPMDCSRSGIVFISSTAGSQQYTKDGRGGLMMHYKCSKTALNMMSILLARQLKEDGIFVASLHPGWVRTDMGTSNAVLSIEDSTNACLKVIGSLNPGNTGIFVDYEGKELPF